jgi:hypothetical protein
MRTRLKSALVVSFGLVALPLSDESQWIQSSFRKIKPNQNFFQKSELVIQVKDSSSPLFYPLNPVKKILGFSFKIEIEGTLPKANAKIQFEEDSPLRVGFVVPGQRRLNTFERWLAPAWILELENRMTDNQGLEKILFFNLGTESRFIGKKRISPLTDLITEEVIATTNAEGVTEVSKKFTSPINTAALWISVSGDNTHSEFKLKIKQLELETEN